MRGGGEAAIPITSQSHLPLSYHFFSGSLFLPLQPWLLSFLPLHSCRYCHSFSLFVSFSISLQPCCQSFPPPANPVTPFLLLFSPPHTSACLHCLPEFMGGGSSPLQSSPHQHLWFSGGLPRLPCSSTVALGLTSDGGHSLESHFLPQNLQAHSTFRAVFKVVFASPFLSCNLLSPTFSELLSSVAYSQWHSFCSRLSSISDLFGKMGGSG